MGIDYKKFHHAAKDHMDQKIMDRSELKKQLELHRKGHDGGKLILSIDRLDYTKGVINRIKAFDIFNQDLSSLRTGRANVHMLDIIKVDVYGQSMAINQLANISTPEPRLLTIQVWDQNNVPLIDAAIKKSNLTKNLAYQIK